MNNKGLRSKKSRLTAVGICFSNHARPFYLQQLALSSPRSGCSVGIYRFRSKSPEVFFFFFCITSRKLQIVILIVLILASSAYRNSSTCECAPRRSLSTVAPASSCWPPEQCFMSRGVTHLHTGMSHGLSMQAFASDTMYKEIKRVNSYCDGPRLCVCFDSAQEMRRDRTIGNERSQSNSLPHEQERIVCLHLLPPNPHPPHASFISL